MHSHKFLPCTLFFVLLAGLLAGCGDSSTTKPVNISAEVDDYTFAVSHILFKTGDTRNVIQALAMARRARDQLQAGESFAVVAKARSEDESAPDGGFLGFIPTGHDTSFAGAVQALSPGEVSPLIRTNLGYHIIKRHTFAEGLELERKLRIPAYGFWIAYGEMPQAQGRTRKDAQELANEIVRALRAGEITMQQARANTPDVLGPQREDSFLGGFPNRAGREDVFAALQKLDEGEYADPVDTDGGFAILQRGRNMRMLVRHVLIRHMHGENNPTVIARTPEEAMERAKMVLKEAQADLGNWAKIVERYSDDELTSADQGTWGVLSPAESPLPIEMAVYNTPPGSLHPTVVSSPLGYHILYRVN